MNRGELQKRLLAMFRVELKDHAQALERDLLALEKETVPEARVGLHQSLFRSAHSLKGAARAVELDQIEAACHRLEGMFAAIRDGNLPLDGDLFRVLFRVADLLRLTAEDLAAGKADSSRSMAELVLALSDTPPQTKTSPAAAPPETPNAPEAHRHATPIRVAAEKLDALIAQSGELLVAEGRSGGVLENLAHLKDHIGAWRATWQQLATGLEKTVAEQTGHADDARIKDLRAAIRKSVDHIRALEQQIASISSTAARNKATLRQAIEQIDLGIRHTRMVPFSEACEGLERTLRDLADDMQKDVELTIEGGDIELDRSVIESLKAPVLQLVRNAIDHGIETREGRAKAGKPAKGKISVGAALGDGIVAIHVADDGRGLDLEAIGARAREKGLADPGAEAQDLIRTIFTPGFSTKSVVTSISGRGVGLDVVKTSLEAIRGRIDVESAKGQGARFLLTVPLTLTRLRALLVEAGGATFALDSGFVRRLHRVSADAFSSVDGGEVLHLDGMPVPVARLSAILGLPSQSRGKSEKLTVIRISYRRQDLALIVDKATAEREVLVQSLGPRLMRTPLVVAATMLFDGSVAPILNVPEIIQRGLKTTNLTAPSFEEESPGPRAKRLLVVDDSVTVRTLERNILEAAGYDVTVASDGTEAWRILQERDVDLIVSDVEMPNMNGFALTKAVRNSNRFAQTPVILLTALANDHDKTRGMEAGANAYLVKSSFDQQELLEAIGQLI